MKVGKNKLFLFLFICVLFSVIISCGIPRMFPWREGSQYEIDGRRVQFRLSFHVDNDTLEGDDITLVPRPGTPVLRFYYLVVPNTSASAGNISTIDNIMRNFGSRYRSSIPRTFGSGEAAYTTSYTYDQATDETISVSLYELSVVMLDEDNNPVNHVPSSSYFEGIEFFQPIGTIDAGEEEPSDPGTEEPVTPGEEQPSEDPENPETPSDGYASAYEAAYSFSYAPANDGGYYVRLVLNGDEENPYYLARSNGDSFTRSTDDYINERSGQDREFLLEDRDEVSQPQIRIYTAASFTFNGYTTRATITTDSTTSSGYQVLDIF